MKGIQWAPIEYQTMQLKGPIQDQSCQNWHKVPTIKVSIAQKLELGSLFWVFKYLWGIQWALIEYQKMHLKSPFLRSKWSKLAYRTFWYSMSAHWIHSKYFKIQRGFLVRASNKYTYRKGNLCQFWPLGSSKGAF